ncbi:MAG: hypothetical protein M1837_006375 [Sclerophora amabilis]|nr:MAG: hypothetical protein M1837_006375 [Sclerophora amabilis]
MEAPDVTDFSSSSSHRLPTVSASQALQELNSTSTTRVISTGLRQLDLILQSKDVSTAGQSTPQAGLSRGQITEIYGPPGVGKTTFGMQMAAHALHAGDHVVWVDCSFSLPGPRLKQMLRSFRPPEDEGPEPLHAISHNVDDLLNKFDHYSVPTLPHLLALLLHTSPGFPPLKTSLIVIDSISTLFSLAFPFRASVDEQSRNGSHSRITPNNKSTASSQQWASGRRWAVLGECISKIGKLAALNNIAVLITTQTATRMNAGLGGTVLVPAISSSMWDAGIANRIVLFRDWPQPSPMENEDGDSRREARYAGVLKVGGFMLHGSGTGKVVPYIIKDSGIEEIAPNTGLDNPPLTSMPIIPGPPSTTKRKHDEVADSQSEEDGEGDFEPSSEEDYGPWIEEAEEGIAELAEKPVPDD